MGLIADLGPGSVAVDTAVFIYFIEENPRFLPLVVPLFREADHEKRDLVTSALTLLRKPPRVLCSFHWRCISSLACPAHRRLATLERIPECRAYAARPQTGADLSWRERCCSGQAALQTVATLERRFKYDPYR